MRARSGARGGGGRGVSERHGIRVWQLGHGGRGLGMVRVHGRSHKGDGGLVLPAPTAPPPPAVAPCCSYRHQHHHHCCLCVRREQDPAAAARAAEAGARVAAKQAEVEALQELLAQVGQGVRGCVGAHVHARV